MSLAAQEIEALFSGRHGDPFSVLGAFATPEGLFLRALAPGADELEAFTLAGAPIGPLLRVDDRGLFEGAFKGEQPAPVRYAAMRDGARWDFADAYSFGPVLGPVDDYLFRAGDHKRQFDKMGAHPISHQGASGYHFAVWAPNAQRVSVVGAFNGWDGARHVMRKRADPGVFEIFIPDIDPGQPYKFEIIGAGGAMLPLKADPYAFKSELRPSTASVTARALDHVWGDQAHRDFWSKADARKAPISIYEVHAASWKKTAEGGFLSWDELADQLIPYVAAMGFTHIEFLPISEHPFDPSWGYQPTGLFAPSARFGDPAGFARFVDGAHRAGISVLLDWVPAHFPMDAHGLSRFDGTCLYEHEDPRKGHHPDWKTAIYNFGRPEVSSFLINNALFWAERYHVDGLRVDAVASMLYLDYSREAGQWLPNEKGGRENLEAVAFLQKMNAAVYGENPGVMTIAEESTAWPGVSRPVHEGGLGFGFKWNMGFMHDTLVYMARDPAHRRFHHADITFGLTYAFSENFVLPLSHDEVVHGKGTLLTKMSGSDPEKFASLRAYLSLMWAYPGKKLLFMGQEFAQRREWSEERSLDWDLLSAPAHEGVRRLVADLNRLYRTLPALHEGDCEGFGFSWAVVDDADQSVFAWLRQSSDGEKVLMVSNMTPVTRSHYEVPVPEGGFWKEIFNSDARDYDGGGAGNMGGVWEKDGRIALTLPPLSTLYFELTRDS